MPIDIAGSFALNGYDGSNAFSILAGSTQCTNIDTTGKMFLPNQIGFIAGKTSDPGWVNIDSSWTSLSSMLDSTVYNVGGGYNTSTGRFTAPVAGNYMFHFTAYFQKLTAVGNYIYCQFAVNGNNISSVKLRNYSAPANYVDDGNMADLVAMNVGDYIEPYTWGSTTGTSRFYPYYSLFSGFLVG